MRPAEHQLGLLDSGTVRAELAACTMFLVGIVVLSMYIGRLRRRLNMLLLESCDDAVRTKFSGRASVHDISADAKACREAMAARRPSTTEPVQVLQTRSFRLSEFNTQDE
ncbi:unnamed protein product (mitochondrion) [Plasmodiophora brassicae]|uniref:Uncharacterized protein n=1 Tax=Plasmodiophora brassicae TaxID=37360 RepID=A0A3P3Y615_PLABS|nr:unnamed protein product [Plasmodiophora brassicae]